MIAHSIAQVGPEVLGAAHMATVETEQAVDLKLLLSAWFEGRPRWDGLARKRARADVGWYKLES